MKDGRDAIRSNRAMRLNTREGNVSNMNQKALENVVLEHLQTMQKDDMDYEALQNVFNLIKNRQCIHCFVRQYNETYFCELIHILFERAWRTSTLILPEREWPPFILPE